MPDLRPIPGFPDYYIDKTGQLYSTKGKSSVPLKQIIKRDGRIYYCLRIPGTRKNKWLAAHRLTASAFLELDLNSPLVVHHRNSRPRDNHVDNLEVCTQKQNMEKIRDRLENEWILGQAALI